MVSPRKRILADRPRPIRRQGTSKLGAVKLSAQGGALSGAKCGDQPTNAQPQAPAQPQQPSTGRHADTEQAQQRASQPQSQQEWRHASASAAADRDAGLSDWGDSSFGFDSPAKASSGAARPTGQSSGKQGARPLSPNLLSHVQRGFRALIDGEAYVSERDRAAGKRPDIDDQPGSPEPSFLNKGLGAFNAVSRAAVGVATSLDSHIEQLMEQHGWADNRPGSSGTSGSAKAPSRSSRALLSSDGGAEDSLFELPSFEGFDAGTTLFGGAAAAVVGSEGDAGSRQASGQLSRQPSAGNTAAAGKQQSPGVAEKMAALLPAFRPKGTVSDFLSEVQQVFGGSQLNLGGLLSLEPAAAKGMQRQQSGSEGDAQLAPPEWGNDSGVFSSVFSGAGSDASSHEEAALLLAAQIQQVQQFRKQQDAVEALGQSVVSPTANKENQGMAAGAPKPGKQQPGAIDWQDFLSGDSQAVQPADGSQAASVVGTSSGPLSRQQSAQLAGCFSPPPPATPPPSEASLARAETPQLQREQAAARQQSAPAQSTEAAGVPEAGQAAEAEGSGAAGIEPQGKAAQTAAVQHVAEPPADGSCRGSPARPPAARPAQAPRSPGTDPISEQVRAQLEALVAEKSALAQENARLLRENTGLQELLSYTMHQNGGGSGSVIGSDDEDALSEWSTMEGGAMPMPSVDNGVSPVKMSRRRLSMDDAEDSLVIAQLDMSAADLDGAAAALADDSILDISAV